MDAYSPTASEPNDDELAERILQLLASGAAISFRDEFQGLSRRARLAVLCSLRSALRAEGLLPVGPITRSLGGYSIVRALTPGGMARVFLARDEGVLERSVVLKTVAKGAKAAEKERLLLEGYMLSRVSHPALPRSIDVREQSGTPFLVLELVPGQRLDLLLNRGRGGGLERFPDVVGAVAELHRAGIVHRDIKPENVLVRPDGSLVLIDLGLAGLIDDERDPLRSQLAGTVPYLAPEQVRTRQAGCDPRTDVFQLGLLAFELATGLRFAGPLEPDTLVGILESPRDPERELRATALSASERRLVRSCLATDPKARPANAGELLERWTSAASAERAHAGVAARAMAGSPPGRALLVTTAVATVLFSVLAWM